MSCEGQGGWSFVPALSPVHEGTQLQEKRVMNMKAELNGAVRERERTMC